MDKEKSSPSVLICGSENFLSKYFVREFVENCGEGAVVTLRQGDSVGAPAVNDAMPALPQTIETVIYAVGATREEAAAADKLFFDKFLRALENLTIKHLVFVSSTEVFGLTEGENIDETADKCPELNDFTRIKCREQDAFSEWCNRKGCVFTTLYCAPIVGTGMTGQPRRLVNAIYRGFYTHIEGNEARTSVVHAVDVARVARLIAPVGGEYILTDGQDPTRHDLAEALAYRLDDKRIFTVSLKRAKRYATLIDFVTFSQKRKSAVKRELSTLTFSSKKLWTTLNANPVSVCNYLKTHDYDKESL